MGDAGAMGLCLSNLLAAVFLTEPHPNPQGQVAVS